MLENLAVYTAALLIASAVVAVAWLKTRARAAQRGPSGIPGPDIDDDKKLESEFRQLLSGIDQRVF
jgi:hypothetical protein